MSSWLHALFDLLAPRRCVACGQRLTQAESFLCSPCLLQIPLTHFVEDAYDNAMARAFWLRLPIERAAALFYYEPGNEVAQLVKDIKYRGNRELGIYAGRMLAETFAPYGFFDGIDGLVPVPLARKRERERGFNQSDLIVRGMASVVGLPVMDDVVARIVYQQSQTHLSYVERNDNVEGAFRLMDGARIAGLHLLLVDDVVTTGATCIACGQELVKAEGVKLSVASLGFTRR